MYVHLYAFICVCCMYVCIVTMCMCDERRHHSQLSSLGKESWTVSNASTKIVFDIVMSTTQNVSKVSDNSSMLTANATLAFSSSLCISSLISLYLSGFSVSFPAVSCSIYSQGFMPFTTTLKASDFYSLAFSSKPLHPCILHCSSPSCYVSWPKGLSTSFLTNLFI